MFGLALAAGLRVMWAGAVIAGSGAGAQAGITPFDYFTAQGLVILRYLWLLLVPLDLTIEPAISVESPLLAALAWGVIAGLSVLASRRFSGARHGFWLLAGFVLLVPSSSIFPAADLAADRRMYFPLVAFGAVAGLLLHRLRLAFLAPAFALLGVLSFSQTRLWGTEQGLWMEAARLAPKHIRPKRQLARLLPPEQALVLLEEARQLAPDDPRVASDLGRVYLSLGRPVLALEQFGRALAAEPNSAEALNNRGVALLMMGQTEAARQDFLRALEKDPNLPDARRNLSRLPK
jgi:tetratricopeptide (TPR) repeat protein